MHEPPLAKADLGEVNDDGQDQAEGRVCFAVKSQTITIKDKRGNDRVGDVIT